MRVKKRKKASRMRGGSTHGHGARKKWKKSGHRGGCGMAGTGKRADHKKTLIIKKYGNEYFGKKGVTSKKTEKRLNKIINVGKIEKEFDNLMEKFGKSGILDLSEYKLLGEGEINKKVELKVREASLNAIDKITKAGGNIEILKRKETENKGFE